MLFVFLICIFLRTKDFGHLFMDFFTIYKSSSLDMNTCPFFNLRQFSTCTMVSLPLAMNTLEVSFPDMPSFVPSLLSSLEHTRVALSLVL
jgi:hypothetical protein